MTTRRLKSFLPILAFAVAFFAAGNGSAQIPQTVNYQGYLTNSAGQPVNAAVNVTFRLYTTAVDAAPVWQETQNGISVFNGIFNTLLGKVTPLSVPFNVAYFLSLQVNSDAEMTTRQPLSAVPYSLRAATAETVAAGATVATSQLTGTLAGAQLAATQLLPTTACAENQIAKWDGKVWVCSSGTAGPTGPPGPQGVQGLTGPAGPQGPAGTILTLPQLQGMFVQSSLVQAPQATMLTDAEVSKGVGSYSSLTIGTDGLPVISYYDITNGDLKVTKCGNAACSAGNVTTAVDTAGDVGQHTSIAVGTDGRPVISYYDVTNGDLKVAKCGDAACSKGNAISSVDTVGDVGQYTSIAIGADGLPVIAYFDVTNQDLKVARCSSALCSVENTITTVDATGDVGRYATLAIGADGLPVISYAEIPPLVNQGKGYIKVAKCGDAACTAGNGISTAMQDKGTKDKATLTIGADGLPILVNLYADAIAESIVAYRCRTPTCSTGELVIAVNNLGPVGGFGGVFSMTTGADGLPVIAYVLAGKLTVTKCGNPSCSASNSSNGLANAGSAGGYPSISLGTDGLPVISYFDSNSNSLKVAKCANSYCVTAYPRR